MARVLALLQMLNVGALGVWAGVVFMTGLAAARTFPTVKQLDPKLPEFAAYDGDHWRLLAGRVANRFFLDADAVQFGCLGVAVATLLGLVVLSRGAWKGWHMYLRIVALSLPLLTLGYQLFVLGPRMAVNLAKHWRAAAAGDNAAAAGFQAAFNADHPTASTVLVTTFFLVLLALGLAAWPNRRLHAGMAGGDNDGARGPGGTGQSPQPAPKLEVPELARKLR